MILRINETMNLELTVNEFVELAGKTDIGTLIIIRKPVGMKKANETLALEKYVNQLRIKGKKTITRRAIKEYFEEMGLSTKESSVRCAIEYMRKSKDLLDSKKRGKYKIPETEIVHTAIEDPQKKEKKKKKAKKETQDNGLTEVITEKERKEKEESKKMELEAEREQFRDFS